MAITREFDVFLSHNSKDKPSVIQLAKELKNRGLVVWLDQEELIPGRPFQEVLERIIQSTGSAAILLGKDGFGPWEIPEMRACLQEFVRRTLPVIPVLLPGAPAVPELPLFLKEFTWVDMREGMTKSAIDRLEWGITGVKALEITRELVINRARRIEQQEKGSHFVDAWGIASVKSWLHALSEVVALAAAEEAALAAATYKHDMLSVIVPIVFEMRWHRGYAVALEKIFKISPPQRHIRDFACTEVPITLPTEGVLSARKDGENRVLILLDKQPALLVNDLEPSVCDDLIQSVNLYGRLGVPSRGCLSLKERIGEIPIRESITAQDELATALFQNREVLAPLIARFPMPGSEWLLVEEENLHGIQVDSDNPSHSSSDSINNVRRELNRKTEEDELFDARQAVSLFSADPYEAEIEKLLKSDAARALFGDLVDTDPEQVRNMIKSVSRSLPG